MEEELRAKAIASMSVSAKPNNNNLNRKPSPNTKEEGELSSSFEPDQDDDEKEEDEEEVDKDQEMPASTATRYSGVAAPLTIETSNMTWRNKLTQGSNIGKCLPRNGVAGRVDKQLPTTITRNQSKHLEMNPVSSKSSSRLIPGMYAPSDANDNLVIRFSDADSETDSDEHKKGSTLERNDTRFRVNGYKRPATSSQPKTKIVQRPRSIQMETMPKKVSSSRTFISSMNKIHGPSFRGFSASQVEREPQIQGHDSLHRSSTTKERGFVRVVNSTDTELESLRQKIAIRENELKLQRKSMPQTKEILSSSDGDYQAMKLDTKAAKMSRPASGNIVGLGPDEQGNKHLKLDEHPHSKLNSDGQMQMLTPVKDSATEFREQVLENSCCINDQNPMACNQCSQCTEAVPVVSGHRGLKRQPEDGDELVLVSSRKLVKGEKHGESSTLPVLMVPSKQADGHLSGAGMPGFCNQSDKSLVPVDYLSLINRTASPAKVTLTSSAEGGASRLLKESSPTKSSNGMLKRPSSCGGVNAPNFFLNKEACRHNLISSSEHNRIMSGDRVPPRISDVTSNGCSNHVPPSRLGTFDASVHDGGLLNNLGLLNGVGHTSSDIQSFVKIEELLDKKLEEAQELRHRCEFEERRALRAYRSAQGALLDANERCNHLYRKRELLSAQLRDFIMEDSSCLWSLRWNRHEETELDSLKNVPQANVDVLPSSSCRVQAHECNMQCTDDAPLDTSHQNITRRDLGADPCSEPDTSTSELYHQKDNGAANGVLSPSNHPNMSVEEDEEIFPLVHKCDQSHLICENKNEKLEEKTMYMSEKSERRSIIENAQDYALLEASLRSKLFARLGMRTSPSNSGLCLSEEPFVDKGADSDIKNNKTHTSTGELSVLSDLPLLNAEQAQMVDTEGLGRPGSQIFQVPIHVHDQSHCDKFSSDYGYHQSNEPEESSSSFKESFRPTCASVSFLPASAPKIVFRHVKVLAPDSSKVFQTSKDIKEFNGILQEKVNSNYDSLIDVYRACASSNCIGEARSGNLGSCDIGINPFWPHCMFELRGKCNNDECTWQHVRDYSKKVTRELRDSASSEGQVSPMTLGKFTDARCIQRSPHHYIMPVPTYRIGTNLIKTDANSYGCMFARSIYQYWQWDFCTSFAVPFPIQRILPPDVPSLHAGDGRVEDRDCWNSLSLYFHIPEVSMETEKQGSAASEQYLELALDLFNGNVNRQEGKQKALAVLPRVLEVNPTFVYLWVVYLHIYYRKEKALGKDDMFHLAIQQNEGSYELWLMYINSRMRHGDRLDSYQTALLTFCRLARAVNKDCKYTSAYILDLFLQMVDFLCMCGDVEKVILRIYELLSPAVDFDNPSHIPLSDIVRYLTISDKCIFWVCCVHLVIYKKLPEAVVQMLEFEQQLPFELEWPSIQIKTDEKHQALELMKMAVEMVTQEINGDSYERDHLNKTALRSAHSMAISHVRCEAAVEGIDSANKLLVGYMKLYPTCIELFLTSARWQKDILGDDMAFERFEEALHCWPKEEPGVQCIWNQYAEFALENGRVTLAEKLMLRWFESVWKGQDPENSKYVSGENALRSNPKDELFGLVNLSLHRLLQDDKVGARLSIDKALKVAAAEDLKHIVREHAVFFLSGGADLVKDTSLSEIPSLLLSYLADVRFFPVSEPLSRRFFRSIKKPRNRQLVNKLLGPVSLDCSLMNSILKELYGPSLLPEYFGKLTDLVDFVEALLDILPANYQLSLSVCKLILRTSNQDGIASGTVMFWACSLLVNSIFQAFPVAPEWVWIEAADILSNLEMWDVSERFHQQSVLVYPFSVKLWSSYYNLSSRTGNMNAIIDAASERGIKLS